MFHYWSWWAINSPNGKFTVNSPPPRKINSLVNSCVHSLLQIHLSHDRIEASNCTVFTVPFTVLPGGQSRKKIHITHNVCHAATLLCCWIKTDTFILLLFTVFTQKENFVVPPSRCAVKKKRTSYILILVPSMYGNF